MILNHSAKSQSQESSFRKVHETMKVLAKEFEYQGYKLKGPCAELAAGNHEKNVSRDIQRGFHRTHLDPVAFHDL